MKKIAVILALVFVMSLALAACNNSTPAESTPAESTPAESTPAESTPEESVAEPVDESSEEPVDESSEEPVDESSEEPEESKSEPVASGSNLALGKSYVIASGDGLTRRGGTYNEHYDANLTDGKVYDVEVVNQDDEDGVGHWFGFNSNTNAPEGVGVLVFDLGETRSVNTVKIHVGKRTDWGVPLMTGGTVAVSTDGENYTAVAEIPKANIPEDVQSACAWVEKSFDSVDARYVRVTCYVAGTWGFLNEVEIYGE